ncbi:MAG TPA: MBL fold metallo-hydrolase [Pyrinomonadaceae bacterium]|jgi:glyoxylase-like metal-dependent hydrolase (beta-lactamase superfamily II)|nr:MBL fold metallo-hydrolase [Pyrinomonadaceae bacterium]
MFPARACLLALVLSCVPAALGQSQKFDVVRIAEGVYAVVRRDAPGFAVESNSLFIVCDDGVIVVDAQSNTAATRETLAALRKITTKPVRYVVNTHWHDDHVVGNEVYREAFPGVEFIAHDATREYLPAQGMINRRKFHAGIPAVVERFRALLKGGRNARGQALTEEERASLESDLALAAGYMTVPEGFAPALPTTTLGDHLTLHRGGRTVEIRFLGRAHTSGDLVVWLPRERVVAAGDLVVYPVPFVGADQSHVGDWGATLEKLLARRPAVIVPGHGPVMRDDSYARLVARLMNSVRQQTAAAVARGETLEQARGSVSLEEFRKLFAGESRVRDALFTAYVVGPAVASAYADAAAAK